MQDQPGLCERKSVTAAVCKSPQAGHRGTTQADAAQHCCSEVLKDSMCVSFPVCPAHLPQPSMLLGVGALGLGVAGPGAVLQQAGRQDTKGAQPFLLATLLNLPLASCPGRYQFGIPAAVQPILALLV